MISSTTSDSSIHFQLSFTSAASEETFANSISIPPQRDAFDSIREEYTTMLQNQLARVTTVSSRPNI